MEFDIKRRMASVSSVERFLRSKRANQIIKKKKSINSCDKRGQLSLLKLPSVARILSEAKKSVLSVRVK